MESQRKSESESTGGEQEVIGAIPARFASTRLPGKPLLNLAGRPMIQHVYERAMSVPELTRVVVLTDDSRIEEAVLRFGGECQRTPEECASGTDRIAWAAREWGMGAVINIQGDEPLIDPEVVGRVARHLKEFPHDPIVTLAVPAGIEDLENPNAVKVVLNRQGYALYFSRAGIPFPRQPGAAPSLRHVGLYGYQREALLKMASLEPTSLEQSESLEQLRALENGMAIRVLLTESMAPGVDTQQDLERVERMLSEKEG